MNEYERRKHGREELTKRIVEHGRQTGREVSEDKARSQAHERADRIDKKRDRNIKD